MGYLPQPKPVGYFTTPKTYSFLQGLSWELLLCSNQLPNLCLATTQTCGIFTTTKPVGYFTTPKTYSFLQALSWELLLCSNQLPNLWDIYHNPNLWDIYHNPNLWDIYHTPNLQALSWPAPAVLQPATNLTCGIFTTPKPYNPASQTKKTAHLPKFLKTSRNCPNPSHFLS